MNQTNLRNQTKLVMIFGVVLCATLGLSIDYVSADLSQTQNSGTSIQQPPSYIIYIVGSTIVEQKGVGGNIPYMGPDAAVAINQAISSLTDGGVILIENGNYNLTSTIKLNRNNVILRGQSLAAILKPAENVDGITVTANDNVINSLSINHVTTGTGNNIKINSNVNRLTISNNFLDDGYHAIYYSGGNSNDIKISNNKIVNAGRAGGAILILNGGILAQIKHVEISNNFIINAQFHGIQVYDSLKPIIQDVKIINNTVDTPSKAGIFVSKINDTLIQGNTILNAKWESLDAEASNNVTFDANDVQNGTYQGISTLPVNGIGNTNVVVTNNIINTNKGARADGIFIDTADGVLISGNNVSVYSDGIRVTNDLSDVTITGNNVAGIDSPGYGIRLDLGTNKTVNKVLIDGNIVKGFYGSIAVISGKITNLVVKNNDISTYGSIPMTLSGSIIINKMIDNSQTQVNTPSQSLPGSNVNTPEQPTTGLEKNEAQLEISQQQPTQINIYGTVKNPRGGSVYLHITKPDGSVDLNWAYILPNGTFSAPMIFDRHSSTGQYKINVTYQNSNLGSLLLNVTSDQVSPNETYGNSNIGITPQSQSSALLLTQIKNDAKLWSQDQISDNIFGDRIQYLIKVGIIKKLNESQVPLVQTIHIPTWFKNNAGWWADGEISDSDFISGIQYLLNMG